MMISKRWIRRAAVLVLGATAVGVVPPALSSGPSASAAPGLGAGGEFFSLTPTRIYDSRETGAKPVNTDFSVPVLGQGGVPQSNVLAVAVNVTIVAAPGGGFAEVRPSDYVPDSGEKASIINFLGGENVPNLAIVGVGADGNLTISIQTPGIGGTAHAVVDVLGFIATSNYDDSGDVGSRLVTVAGGPGRIADTRGSQVPASHPAGKELGSKQSIEIAIRGADASDGRNDIVPNDPDVVAVALNLTGINNQLGGQSTYLSVTPALVPTSASDAPSSNGNYPRGVRKANFVIAPVNANGSVFIYNRSGNIDIAVDVLGYFLKGENDTSLEGRIVPLEAPFRAFDTREPEFNSTRLGFSSWENWSFDDFANSVTLDGQSVGAQSGFLGNIGATALERIHPSVPVESYITMNPTDGTPPDTPSNSNLNFPQGRATSNMSLITYGADDGDNYMVSAYNNDGRTHYFLDVYAVILSD
jgi:hypothetical protein